MGGVIKKDNVGFQGNTATTSKEYRGPPGLNGGLISTPGGNINFLAAKKTYDIQNKVYVLKIKQNNTKFKFKQLSPFPFKKKVGNIIHNEYGKFFCFVIENHNRELPQLVVYDIRKIFPQFDRYHQEQQDVLNHIQQIDGKDVRALTASKTELAKKMAI